MLLAVSIVITAGLRTVVVLSVTTLCCYFSGRCKFGNFSHYHSGIAAVVMVDYRRAFYRVRRITSFLEPWEDPFVAVISFHTP